GVPDDDLVTACRREQPPIRTERDDVAAMHERSNRRRTVPERREQTAARVERVRVGCCARGCEHVAGLERQEERTGEALFAQGAKCLRGDLPRQADLPSDLRLIALLHSDPRAGRGGYRQDRQRDRGRPGPALVLTLLTDIVAVQFVFGPAMDGS